MDSTLLGALIGAGAAISGALATSLTTHFLNKKQEKIKLLTIKKEEVYKAIETLKLKTTSQWAMLINVANGHDIVHEKYPADIPSPLSDLNMLLSIYFPILNDARNEMNETHKELNLRLLKTYTPKSIRDKKDDFLGTTYVLYRDFLNHVDGIQKQIVNLEF